ncbi:MAG: hypothetical protein SGJ19_14285 [Planctomycetia bacterium]|nr:hypothetical protein [Planctomycetia bacterium]
MYQFWRTKSAKLTGALLALALVVSGFGIAQANPVLDEDLEVGDKVWFRDREGNIGGGEYGTVKLPATNSTPDLFRTFCVERNQSLDFSDKGFFVSAISDHTSSGKALDPMAAFLYWHFRMGTLAGYSYGNNTAAHILSANGLQAALWLIQKESGYTSYSSSTFKGLNDDIEAKAKVFVDLAKSKVLDGTWTGIGLVRVAQIVWSDRYTVDKYGKKKYSHRKGDPAQDVLILIPEPASIVFWLTAGSMAGVGAVIRRRREALAV